MNTEVVVAPLPDGLMAQAYAFRDLTIGLTEDQEINGVILLGG